MPRDIFPPQERKQATISGNRVLIDKNGKILAGLGGKFDGVNVSEMGEHDPQERGRERSPAQENHTEAPEPARSKTPQTTPREASRFLQPEAARLSPQRPPQSSPGPLPPDWRSTQGRTEESPFRQLERMFKRSYSRENLVAMAGCSPILANGPTRESEKQREAEEQAKARADIQRLKTLSFDQMMEERARLTPEDRFYRLQALTEEIKAKGGHMQLDAAETDQVFKLTAMLAAHP